MFGTGSLPKSFMCCSPYELCASSCLFAKLRLDLLRRGYDVSVLLSVLASCRLGFLVLIDLFNQWAFGLIYRLFFGMECAIDIIFEDC